LLTQKSLALTAMTASMETARNDVRCLQDMMTSELNEQKGYKIKIFQSRKLWRG
jgi:hypothetical protein